MHFYIDDLLFCKKDEVDNTQVFLSLRGGGVGIEQEDAAAEFLGDKLERDGETGLNEMHQDGFIERVISQLVLNDGSTKSKFTPSEAKLLVNDEDDLFPSGQFSYNSVICMMMYLSGHTDQGITYEENFCLYYMFYYLHSHYLTLKMICLYLKGTSTKGFIFNPFK